MESPGQFKDHTLITIVETISGLGVAALVSFLLAFTIRMIPVLEPVFMPYAVALKSMPVVALAPLLVIWFGNGLAGKVFLSALICFFPILIGLIDGMKVDRG